MGGVSGYSVETVFVSQCRKKLWRNPSTFQKNSSVGKNSWRRDEVFFFRRKVFVSQCQKIPWGNHSMFIKNGVPKKFMHEKGKAIFSVESFCSHSAEKKSVFQKNSGIEIFYT